MIKVEHISAMNFDNALRGMRNPLESWDKSDSFWCIDKYIIGEKDMEVALKLIKAGTDHSKFMRQIFVSMDITAPDYWFKEFDTYKISTVANSTSTMHKITSRFLTENDFSWDNPNTLYKQSLLNHINSLIAGYKEYIAQQKDLEAKEIWRQIIQDLPMSFNYKRTVTLNYQVLRNIYFSRNKHKLTEWRDFCKVIEDLPYSQFITVEGVD